MVFYPRPGLAFSRFDNGLAHELTRAAFDWLNQLLAQLGSEAVMTVRIAITCRSIPRHHKDRENCDCDYLDGFISGVFHLAFVIWTVGFIERRL